MKCFRLFFAGLITCFLSIFNVLSKEAKPKVLVYGDNLEAFAAAIQSSRSNVPTLWVIPSLDFCSKCDFNISPNAEQSSLVSGIWINILQIIAGQHEKKDSILNVIQRDLTPQRIRAAMDSIISTQSNLTILKDVKVTSVINKKKSIDVALSNKKKLNFISIVDATERMELVFMANVDVQTQKSERKEDVYEAPIQDLKKDILRTLVTIGFVDNKVYGFTVKSILARSIDNLFFTDAVRNPSLEDGTISTKLSLGQAIGASAAYCAYFRTTSDNIEVRKLQSELMIFDSRLLPFVNIPIEDPNFNALQKFFLSQILPWDSSEAPLMFNGFDSVSVESIRPVIQQFYSRAQLWYIDNQSTYFTVKDVIELIKVISYRSDELDEEVKKAWKKRFKFERDFQAENLVSRYEFAVLLDAYADPFAKRISLDGNILR